MWKARKSQHLVWTFGHWVPGTFHLHFWNPSQILVGDFCGIYILHNNFSLYRLQSNREKCMVHAAADVLERRADYSGSGGLDLGALSCTGEPRRQVFRTGQPALLLLSSFLFNHFSHHLRKFDVQPGRFKTEKQIA